jgi:hypothetical protein
MVILLRGCPTEAVTPVKHFGKLSVTAAEKLCAGVIADGGNCSRPELLQLVAPTLNYYFFKRLQSAFVYGGAEAGYFGHFYYSVVLILYAAGYGVFAEH